MTVDDQVASIEKTVLGFRSMRDRLEREIMAAIDLKKEMEDSIGWAAAARERLAELNREISTQSAIADKAEKQMSTNVALAKSMVTQCEAATKGLGRLLDALSALGPLAAEQFVSERTRSFRAA